LNVLVVNGIGLDAFYPAMIRGAGRTNLPIIKANAGVPLLPTAHAHEGEDEDEDEAAMNSHTTISVNAAILQINNIAQELGKLRPDLKQEYAQNARAYVRELRKMLGGALAKLDEYDAKKLRVATVHDGYVYLFRDLGLEVVAVIEPADGMQPDPKYLAEQIAKIRAEKVNVLFAEEDFPSKFAEIIQQETGVKVGLLSHVAGGSYTTDKFQRDMQRNLDAIVKAFADARSK
jgi:zinc transport system substrate-binding protein